jgi:hypothetical protein
MVDGQVMSGVYPETKLYAGSVPGSPRPTLSISPQAVYADRGSEADLAGVEVRDKLVVVDLPADADQTGVAVVVASIASAGGRFVLFHVVEPAVKPAARLQAASGKQLPLPAAVMENTDAAGRLIDLVKAAPIGLAVATIPQTPFQYKLDFVDRHAAARRGGEVAAMHGDEQCLPYGGGQPHPEEIVDLCAIERPLRATERVVSTHLHEGDVGGVEGAGGDEALEACRREVLIGADQGDAEVA